MHHHKLRVVLNTLTPRKRYKWKTSRDEQIQEERNREYVQKQAWPSKCCYVCENPIFIVQTFFLGQNDGKHGAIYKQEHATCNRQIFKPS